MSSYLERVDLPFYRKHLEPYLPERIIDIHSHVGRMEHVDRSAPVPAFWADRMCLAFAAESIVQVYRTILPGKSVTPVWFAFPRRNVYLDQANAYAARAAHEFGTWSLLVSRPTWSGQELTLRVEANGAAGLKPYFYLVNGKPSADVTVFDCLPHHHLHLADQKHWLVILHLPRAGRLADPLNIAQVKEICRSYPHVKLVIAHVGRAYCPSFAERGLAALRDCPNLYYDISANCNEDVFKLLIQSVGPQRILYGSDLPLVTLRLRRICEGDAYVNLVRKTRFADAQTRRDLEHENSFTFLLYESLAAFLRAARSSGLHRSDLEDVFYRNALGLLEGPM
jgi:predicted TIM-barrel fold metal-dependent hydrolase